VLASSAGALPPEPHFQSILLWLLLLWRWGIVNYLPGLTLKYFPPDLSLPRSWDYRQLGFNGILYLKFNDYMIVNLDFN
jgi:hypothetical protein